MEIQETPQGLIVSVKVKPSSPKFALIKKGEELILEVTAPPQEGKANQEIMKELSALLRCEVQVLRGSASRKKLLMLKGISTEELEAVLDTR